MISDVIKNRSIQSDLMRNAAQMLQAVACMDDETLAEISDIVEQVEALADRMEARIANPKPPQDTAPFLLTRPHLYLVR